MAYPNSYFPATYPQVTAVPQQNYIQSQPTTPQPQYNQNGIIWVQGEAAARSYPVYPNQSVMLMDSEENVFYIKTADASGMPLPLRTFDYSERTTAKAVEVEAKSSDTTEYVTREEFESRLSEFQSMRKTFQRKDNPKS